MINQIVARYRILKKLGQGGMGEVYLAEDKELGRKAALKFLPPQYSSDPELNARFKREARAAAALNHPNIITIYDVGEYQNRAWIAMEFVDGESLRDLIARQELAISEVIDIAIQICEGLGEAHRAGIIHRDLKPANILLNKKGRVKIADFGLARRDDATSLSMEGVVMGTPAYMSPEQFQVQGKKLDQRSDIFSLGVVIYEMITRRLPFAGENPNAIFYAIMNEAPEPLARYKARVPEGLQRLVDKALEKDRQTRYRNVEDLLVDLQREKRNLLKPAQPTATMPAPPKQHEAPKPPPATPKPRRWLPKFALAGVGVILLALLVKSLLPPAEENGAKSPAAELATVSIATTPEAAAVFMNGSPIGNTPITGYRANAGRVALRIQKPPNYFTLDTTVVLVKGSEAKFDFKLKPVLAAVTIQVSPGDAEVILDGERLAPSRLTNRPLALGAHSLNISRQGYKTVQTQFRLSPGDTTLRYTLAPEVVAEYGTIRVLALLDGRVYIDGNSMGSIASGEAREYEQPVGRHKVDVRSAGETVTQNVTVTKGKTVAVTLRPKPTAPPVETKPAPKYVLRQVARDNLSGEEVKVMVQKYDFYCAAYDWTKEWSNPRGQGIPNDFVLQQDGKIVVDRATGLMWQQSGSEEYMIYEKAKPYISQLNRKNFGGYSDWRLPTLEEAMSLMEQSELNGDLHIDPKFDPKQRWIWTADKKSAGVAWVAFFNVGKCGYYNVASFNYVRAVRGSVGQ
ncbi:MAG: protein kinase [candidate division KSB1 bacterium]|nr:protein kinase [candidate division KSB1 bacterium]MDZ7365708.1 protein kinase [candidate division KSB1 bacterium]MDZ7403216.1 protein kinase [candidate division KSB1 bacterium]